MRGIYALIKGFPDTIKHAWEDIEVPKLAEKPKRIVVFGMGANYNAGLLLKEMLREKIHVDVSQVPGKKEEGVLYIFLSYSGNTKEVVNAFKGIIGNKNMLVVTSGGILMDFSKKRKVPIIEVPPHLHPRFTFSECFFPVLKCLGKSGIIENKSKLIGKIYDALNDNEHVIEKEARKLAGVVRDKLLCVYGTEFFYPVAYRFQSSIAEDDKVICHANKITELFHNELEALPNTKYFPIIFVDSKEAVMYKGQIEFFRKKLDSYLYFGYENYPKEVRAFLAFYLAYFLGFYLAIQYKNKVSMGETPVSDEIKKK